MDATEPGLRTKLFNQYYHPDHGDEIPYTLEEREFIEAYYNAILMDIQMPNMDGYEATRAIRGSSHPDAKKIQIIALTANVFTEDIAKALSVGMNAHAAKPIESEVLADTLRKAFAE